MAGNSPPEPSPLSLQSSFPQTLPTSPNHHLIVTTASGVYAWNSRGTVELFSSGSDGIVTALKINTNQDMLAVADSQVVVLHDMDKGTQRSYRLKNEKQGQVRKLFYHPGKERLFFTTSLQNAVQSFSIKTLELLDAAPVHPSPPTVFGVSPACDLLISASADPPIIYLSRIAYKQPPLLFQPNCSGAAVVAIAFHPTRSNVFAIGFQDGTIAAYNATPLGSSQRTKERYSFARIHGEISHVARLHERATVSPDLSNTSGDSLAPTISAIHFIADHPCSIISIGLDGKCCIVAFKKDGVKQAQVIQHWYLQAPATSLAVLKTQKYGVPSQLDGFDDDKGVSDSAPIYLAIGKSDGTVGIYTRDGKLLATRDFSKDGKILDLEWMQRSKDKQKRETDTEAKPLVKSEAPNSGPSRSASVPDLMASPPRTPLRSARSSISSRIMVKVHAKEPPPEEYLLRRHHTIGDIVEETHDKSSSELDGASPPIESVGKFTIVEKDEEEKVAVSSQLQLSSQHVQALDTTKDPPRTSHSTTSSRGSRKPNKKRRIPIVPARPVARAGGKLALRRIESAKARRASVAPPSPIPNEIVRAVTTGQPQFKNINNTSPLRPRMIRHQSSKISPFTESSRPFYTPNIPKHQQHASTGAQVSPIQPTAPVQYDRLNKTSWDAESSTGTSLSSFVTAPRPGPLTPTRSPLAGPASLRIGSVRQTRPVTMEAKAVVPSYVSDSGTSQASVLDWTPARIERPKYVFEDANEGKLASPLRATLPQGMTSASPQKARRFSMEPDSDISSASQLDWHIGRQPVEQIYTKPSHARQPAAEFKDRQPEGRRQVDFGVDSEFKVTSPVPAPLQIPKLRKQETVINLKDKGKAKSDGTISAAGPIASSIVQEPRLSDPGPTMKATESTGPVVESQFPSISMSAPPTAVPASRRVSSQLKSLFESQRLRSASTVGSQSTYTIEDVIRIECAAICTRMDIAFEEHKAWLQGYLREQNWYADRLEVENRQFREELARIKK